MDKNNKIIPLTFDIAFKKIFCDNNHKERAALLLSIILKIPYKDLINNIALLNNSKRILSYKDKKMESDIVIRLSLQNIVRINLEMNKTLDKTKINRNILYATGLLSNQLKVRDRYNKIEPIIQINFNLKYVDQEERVLIDEYIISNKRKKHLSNILKIYHVNIVECRKIYYNKTINKYKKDERQIILFGALLMEDSLCNFKKILEDIDMEEGLRDNMIDAVEEYSEDENMCIWYDKEHNDRALFNGSIEEAKEEGIESGIKYGIEYGINKRNNEIARKMLMEKIPISVIKKCTGLSYREINSISL